jgi:hypothetical protein
VGVIGPDIAVNFVRFVKVLIVVRVLGYRSRGPGSIPGTTRKKM